MAAFFCVSGCDKTVQEEAKVSKAAVSQSYAALENPNIFLITLEDLSPKFGAFGDPVAHTPNIDNLAARGIRFTRVFTTAGVCAPSRSALITGVHQQTLGTMHMRTSSFGRDMPYGQAYEAVPPAHVKAFPELLRAAGYYTLNKAKTDYQFGKPFTVWDEDSGSANWKNAPDDKPLFAMINFNQTHESFGFPTDIPVDGPTANRNAKNFVPRNKKFDQTKTHFTNPDDVSVPPYYPDTAETRNAIARYYDNVARTDALVGELLEDIRKSERGENAVIILTTDHGDGLPRAKRTLYDSGLHVPMIIAYPDGRGAGTVRDELISFVDLAPTILALAGAPIPEYIQGRIFEGDVKSPERDFIYAAADRLDEREQRQKAVRSTTYKYIRNFTPDKPRLPNISYQNNNRIMQNMRDMYAEGRLAPEIAKYFDTPSPEEEFYDLVSDPFEVNNLATDPAANEKLERHRNALREWIDQSPDLSALSEVELVESFWPNATQPVTAMPEACLTDDNAVSVHASTDNASIGYQYSDMPWQLYTGPIEPPEAVLEMTLKAVRYGYKESPEALIDVETLERCAS